MNAINGLTPFAPDWLWPWIGVVAVASLILGAKRLATTLGVLLGTHAIVVPMLEPWIDTLPTWAIALGTMILLLSVIQAVLTLLFGKEASGQFVGTWLVRLGDLLLIGPFRFIGYIVTFLIRR